VLKAEIDHEELFVSNLRKLVSSRFKHGGKSFETRVFAVLTKLNSRFSSVGDKPIFEVAQFPWSHDLESKWTDIRGEVIQLLSRLRELPDVQSLQVSAGMCPGNADQVWRTLILYDYGHKNPKSCELCPRTTEIVERIPGMTTALFSILGPKKHIERHRGPYNGILRYHLGLIVPKSRGCRIQVASSFAEWTEGQSIIFDDSYPHEVWNDTTELRVVLFLDVVRPLPFPISIANRVAIRRISRWSFMQNVRTHYSEWERSHLGRG
jgi:beta-hydroxylase